MYTVSHENHTPINPKGFRWMPAAIEYTNHGGLGCYVRHKRYQDKPITLRFKSTNRILLECPDRDLMLVRDQHTDWPYKPAEGVWDEYVNFGLSYPNAMVDTDVQFWMANYTEFITNDRAPRLRDGRTRAPHEPFLVADSGGFQLSHGRYDWIDPLELIKWYNANVDIGMVLDIPPWGISQYDDFILTAKAQAKNTDLMMRNRRPDLELFNIVHGQGSWSDDFHDIVYRDDVTKMAIGGIYSGGILGTMDSAFGLMSKYQKEYQHFHILGIWNLLQLVPIMRFAGKGIVDLITSDSSTPIQNANAKRYAYHPAIDDTWSMRDIGLTSLNTHANHHLHLPCKCVVCDTLKYTDTLSILSGALLTHTLAHHNVYQMNNYIKTMYPLTQSLSPKELVELMLAQLGNRRGIQEAKWGVQFADAVADHGFEAARKKFSAFLIVKNVDYMKDDEASLFSDHVENSNDSIPDSDLAQNKLRLAKRFLSSEYADKGTHGKKIDNAAKGLVVSTAKPTKKSSGVKNSKSK